MSDLEQLIRKMAPKRGKRKMTEAARRYYKSERGKIARKRYRDSAKGQEARRRGERARSAWRQRVYKLVESFKQRPCADCGGTFDPICMDFDHRPGEVKIGTVSHMVSRAAYGDIEAEIAKCDVVCANCHRIRTYRKRNHREAIVRARLTPRETTTAAQQILTLFEDEK